MSRSGLATRIGEICAAGSSPVLAGPPGIGKTTLLREVLEHEALAAGGSDALKVATSATSRRIPLGALAPLLPVEVCAAPTAAARLSAAAAHFGADAQRNGLFVIDDLHELDDESVVLIHHLLAAGLVRLIGTTRNDQSMPAAIRIAARAGLIELIEVPPLSLDDTAAAFSDFLGSDVVAPDSTALLHAASEGNPLLVRELVRHGLAAGTFRLIGGVWRLDSVPAMPSIHEQLAERVRGWDDDVRACATVVASLGPLPLPLADELCGDSTLARAAWEQAIVTEHDVVRIVHPLLGEVLSSTMAHGDRLEALRRAVKFMLVGTAAAPHWMTTVASMMLELNEHEPMTDDDLVAAATNLLTAARSRPDLSERLLVAVRRPTATSTGMLAQVRAMRGDADRDGLADDERALDVALGRLQGFMLGHHDEPDVADRLARASAHAAPHRRPYARANELMLRLWSGEPIEPLVEQLLALSDTDDPQLAGVSAMSAAAGLGALGRLAEIDELANRLGSRLVNPHHRLRLAFSKVEAAHRSAGRHRAAAVLAAEFPTWTGRADDLSAIYRAFWGAQFAVAAGCPADVVHHHANLIARSPTSDGGGIRTFAQLELGQALLWSGANPATAPVPSIPARARLHRTYFEVVEARRRINLGDLRGARQLAISASVAATVQQARFEALESLLVASLIEPGAELAERAATLAKGCDGAVVDLFAEAIRARSIGDGEGLAATAARFGAIGYEHWALEVLTVAAQVLRSDGRRSSARSATETADRLIAAGTIPLRPSNRSAAAAGLTPREHEVALLAATGMRTADIAVRIGVSPRTVETHLHRVYLKLAIHDRSQLAGAGFG